MTSANDLVTSIQHLLASQRSAVLATQGSESPYCSLVGYVALHGHQEIIFATRRGTRKHQNIRQNSAVSLLIDTRARQARDFSEAQALTVLGQAAEIDVREKQAYQDLFLKRHPYLREFVLSPACVLIKITVDQFVLVDRFERVREYTVS